METNNSNSSPNLNAPPAGKASTVSGVFWKFLGALVLLTFLVWIAVFVLYATSAPVLAVVATFVGSSAACFLIPSIFRRTRFTRAHVIRGGLIAILVMNLVGYLLLPPILTAVQGRHWDMESSLIQGTLVVIVSALSMLAGASVYLRRRLG